MPVVQINPAAADQIEAERTLPRPLSMTHRHLLSCVNTFLLGSTGTSKVTRILDVGCGDGLLVKYLGEALSFAQPGRQIEVFGMDVHDHGVQPPGYWANTLSLLSGALPSIDWRQRLKLVSITDPWPFPDAHFDVVVSNQVLEHVGDHAHFFQQHRRVLSSRGTGFHLFPLHYCIIEPHLKLPLVHWVSNRELRRNAIAITTRLGLGKFTVPRDQLDSYAAAHADYLTRQVNYKTQREIAALVARTGLIPSFAMTHHYFMQKFRSVTGRPFVEVYPSGTNLMGSTLANLLRYASSVTLEIRQSGACFAETVSAAPSHRWNA